MCCERMVQVTDALVVLRNCTRVVRQLLLLLGALWLLVPVADAATTQYAYDDLGRIIQATRSDGSIIQYEYDQNGNVTAINRTGVAIVSIVGISPLIGHAGAIVTISGTGFSAVPGENIVKFGTSVAAVSSATTTALVVTVPQDAVTAPITVTVAGNSATSSSSFIVRRPSVISFSPAIVDPGTPITALGTNFNLIPGTTAIKVGEVGTTITSLSNGKVVFPAPNASGLIRVVTPYGEASSPSQLIVAPPAIGTGNLVSVVQLPVGGGAQTLSVGQANKYGAFKFTATANQYLSIQVNSLTTTPSNGSLAVTIYSPSNAVLISGTVSNTAKTIHLPRIDVAGTYLVALRSTTGAFELSVNLEVNTELARSATTQLSTSVTSQTKRAIFTATAGESVGLGFTNVVLTPTTLVTFTVEKPDGTPLLDVLCNPSSQPGCQLSLRNLPATGTYRVTAATAPWVSSTMTFRVTLSPQIGGTLLLDSPQTMNLTLPGQYAVLNFTATAGQTVAVGSNTLATTPANKQVQLTVFNAAGTQVGQVSSTTVPTLNLTNLAAGTYSVLVNTVDAATASIEVRLAFGMTGVLPLDGTSQSFASTVKSQLGYFAFNATAGQNVGLAITDLVMSAGNVTALDVYRPNGVWLQQLLCNPATKPGCQRSFRNLPDTGTYRIVASPNSASATMSFRLTMTQHLAAALALDTPQPFNVAAPGQYANYTFTATAGQTVAVNANTITTTPAGKPVQFTVFSAAGTQLGSISSASDPTVNLPSLAAGTYSIEINAVDASVGAMQIVLASGMTGVLPLDGTSQSFASTVKSQLGYFTFNATAGQNVGLAITGLVMSAGSVITLDVYRPNGAWWQQLSCNPATQPGCQRELNNLPETGTYKIIAGPNANATMSFTLTLSQHLSGALTTDTPQILNLAPGQYARLTFTASAGQTRTLSASAVTTTPAGKPVQFTVFNAAGAQIGSTSSTTAPTLNLPSLAAGTYTALINTTLGATATMNVVLH